MPHIIEAEKFTALFKARGITITDTLYAQLDTYAAQLVDWNGRINLTAITDAHGITVRHFLDSLLPLTMVELPQGASLIDVGTGAGFPSIPMKLYRPDLQLTLLDSLNKRVLFLAELCENLRLSVDCMHARAEEAGRNPKLRERFDVATARAVANLAALTEYCLPFVKVGGMFLALKGPSCADEIAAAENAVTRLGGKVESTLEYELADGEMRTLVLVRKISQTPTEYPRAATKIAKNPL